MHGPRSAEGPRRMPRGKRVTFHERCDVLEYEPDDMEQDDMSEGEAEIDTDHSMQEDGDPFTAQSPELEDRAVEDDEVSYESIQLGEALNPAVPSLLSDPDTSITGIVEEMFLSSKTSDLFDRPAASTPPRISDIPTDLETEDGVPFGRTHHAERAIQFHDHSSPASQHIPHFSPHQSPFDHRHSSPSLSPLPPQVHRHDPPVTPPRRSLAMTRNSSPPLGRSTHLERIVKAREEERLQEEDEDVDKIPASPSPMKKAPSGSSHLEGLIPRFDLRPRGSDIGADSSTNIEDHPFVPSLQDESALSLLGPDTSGRDGSMDESKLYASDANASHVLSELDRNEVMQNLEPSPYPKGTPERQIARGSPSASIGYMSPIGRRIDSPSSRSGSPLAIGSSNSLTKTTSRERISREDVHRRLIEKNRNSPSPVPDRPSSRSSLLPTHFPLLPKQNSSSDLSDKDHVSVLTTQTDFSTETAVVETAEKKVLGLTTATTTTSRLEGKEFGMLVAPSLDFDFGSRFSLGGFGVTSREDVDATSSLDSRETRDTYVPDLPESRSSGIKMGDVDVDMDMKSALDRLMEDVAGAGGPADDSMEEYDESFDRTQSTSHSPIVLPTSRPKVIERAATDSVLLQLNEADGIMSRTVSGSSTVTLPPPPVPPKDNIKNREQLILEKRREARRMEEGDFITTSRGRDRESLGVGRPSRRRSMSTGDAEVISRKRSEIQLDVVKEDLGDSIEKELRKMTEPEQKSKYHIREHETTIYASSSEEKVKHMAGAGDLDSGRAWRTVRRPSDMNEYAKQIKEYRAQDKAKAYGKVFVKVLGVRGLHLPLPQQPTAITCTLNNGIHFVTTPECQLAEETRIEQEFELIEHSKLEFTLTLKVRRDPHIIAQYKALSPAPAPAPQIAAAPPPVKQASRGGMRGFFSSSPKKSSKEKMPTQQAPPPAQPSVQHRLPENLARFLKPDGTLARAFISFKDVASRCDTRLFETSYPLVGQRVEAGGKFSTIEYGEIVLQLFRLPPLPGIPQDQLPQSLEECHRGLRHINWHKVTYFQGTLTQSGGDCSTWRRRQLRVIGSNLVAFNDVTKKATATIDLKKAIAVEDDQSRAKSYGDEYEGLYGVERSFRLIFPQEQEILFFADSDDEKAKWLEVLRALVGHIPPHPLWAELLWQRQNDITKQMTAAQHAIVQPTRPPAHR